MDDTDYGENFAPLFNGGSLQFADKRARSPHRLQDLVAAGMMQPEELFLCFALLEASVPIAIVGPIPEFNNLVARLLFNQVILMATSTVREETIQLGNCFMRSLIESNGKERHLLLDASWERLLGYEDYLNDNSIFTVLAEDQDSMVQAVGAEVIQVNFVVNSRVGQLLSMDDVSCLQGSVCDEGETHED